MDPTPEATWTIDAAGQVRALERTRAILDRLFVHLKKRRFEGNFAIRLWNGEVMSSETARDPGQEPEFTLVLTHPGSLRRMFWPPGELTLTEAYLRGDFDVEGDLVATMSMAETFAKLTASDWVQLIRQARNLPQTSPPDVFKEGRQPLRLRGQQHSQERDREAVTYHYNIGNDFYELYLGRWMAYSCAYFESPQASLDEAQTAKFEYICRKLRLRPGERLLDIGCGWGGLIVYAAEHYGVQATGINLSQPQIDYARAWIDRAGLGDRVTAENLDYRAIDPGRLYDKIVSVGMVEHVGRVKLEEYFQAAFNALRPGGLFLNHAIASRRTKPIGWLERTFLKRGEFNQRYIFPDGELIPISEMLAAAEKSGFEVRDVESLREHYALTLRHWVSNLEANHAKAVELNDERTYRTWRMYMAGSAHGFDTGNVSVFQSLLAKNRDGSSGLPLTRADLYDNSDNGRNS